MNLAEGIVQVRRRTDTVNNDVVTDEEIASYINLSQKELYGLLIQTYGSDYALSSANLSYSGSTTTASLPADFFKIRGVDLLTGGNPQWITLKQFNLNERNLNPTSAANIGSPWWSMIRYRLQGDSLWIEPQPAACTIRLWYAPKLDELVDDADEMISYNGWEEYTIVDASIKVMQKQDLDVRVLLTQKAALVARLNSEMENRDASGPATVSDITRTGNGYYDQGGGYGWGGGWY